MKRSDTVQKEFNRTYITTGEIVDMLKVNRVAVLRARESGLLPAPIIIQGSRTHLWIRKQVQPHLDAWNISLKRRRGELAA